jgi:pimeloyl-ACP methyl ester carboxylesterase
MAMHLRQDIRFCTTRDGVRIAHAASGTGPPLVRAGTWMNHLELDAQEPDSAARFGQLGRRNTLIRYDARGSGLSDRHVSDITFDGFLADLEAVVDARELATFSLLGMSAGAALSLAYAAMHPRRVERIVILNGFVRSYFSSTHATPEVRAEAELILRTAQQGWESAGPSFARCSSASWWARRYRKCGKWSKTACARR